MNYGNVKKYVKKAFEKGEVELLLLGRSEYMLLYPYQFNIPLEANDYDKVVEEVNEFLKENNSEENIKKFEDAIINLSNDKPFHSWVAFTIFYLWKISENENKVAFSLSKEIQESVKKGIEKNEEPLKTHHLLDDNSYKTYMENINYYCDKYRKLYNQNLL